MIIYCFDLKTKDLESYNRIKRRFYYDLAKLSKHNFLWNTKSVICIDEAQEALFDLFFLKYRENLALFKARASSMEQVY
ncbi:hypothetical protein COU37_05955 [Candidatus Micrarchaeota archaeon CG10_big_fil_rev_8_21_14_0_10_45_29]|nr:MAG: hypothetical protein COU37_05955 [Candidatus Micrarchaeota archaeon CG10_big_fil_rev_8_21_14_0_10_45_29]